MKVTRIIFLMITLFTLPVYASEESHMLAAQKMVDAANLDKMLQEMYQQINDMIIRNLISKDPCLEGIRVPLTELLLQYDQKILNAGIVKSEIQKVYKQEFTEEEINQIVAFYHTPAGKKALEKAPLLASKGLEIAQREINKSKTNGVMDELQKEVNILIDGIDPNTLSSECKKKFDDKKAEDKKAQEKALIPSTSNGDKAESSVNSTTPVATDSSAQTPSTTTTKEKAK